MEVNDARGTKLKQPRVRVSLICAVILGSLATTIGIIVLSTLKLSDPKTILGPGFYPLLLSLLMIISCLFIIYRILYGDREDLIIKSAIDAITVKKPIALFVLVILCVAAMPLFGFVGSMSIFSLIYMTFLEKNTRPLLWRLIYSTGIAGGVFLLFRALQIHLPVPIWL